MTIQGLFVVAIAALATAFLAWRVIGPFVRNSSPGCHGCSTPCELKTASRRTPCVPPGQVPPDRPR
jgi:hypothetical protein